MHDAPAPTVLTPEQFIARWKASGAAEQANSQSFLGELCDLLGVPRPEPTRQDDAANVYVFEKVVEIKNGDGTSKLGRIDLYRRGCFVLESKQGSERKLAEEEEALSKVVRGGRQKTGTAPRGTKAWEQAMTRARNQAKRYAEALPDEWPPLLIVCDVGHCIDLYADFARTGKNYAPFPDPQSFRLRLEQLADPAVRERLRLAWLDPLALDPGRRSAKVTRNLAAKLAELAKRLERRVGGGGSGEAGDGGTDSRFRSPSPSGEGLGVRGAVGRSSAPFTRSPRGADGSVQGDQKPPSRPSPLTPLPRERGTDDIVDPDPAGWLGTTRLRRDL